LVKRVKALFWTFFVLVIPVSLHASSIPEFCQTNFPVLDRERIDRDLHPVTFTSPDGVERHCLRTHQAGLEVSVAASDIMRFYSDVQEVEYRRAAESFRRSMREKVLRSLVQSMQPYEDLFQRQSCSDIPGSGHSHRTAVARCERAQNIVPSCEDPELASIIQEEDQLYVENLEAQAREVIESEYIAAGHPESALNDIPVEQLQNAERYLSDYKKETFLRANINASILAQALMKKKSTLEETFRVEMRRNDNSLSAGFGEFGSQTNELEAYQERMRVIEQNHEREMEQVQEALSRLYERYPTVLNVKNSTRFLFFSNSDYELSPLAQTLSDQFQEENPSFDLDRDHNELSDYLSSEEASTAINQMAERQIMEPNEELDDLGRTQVFGELAKKREAIEMLCNDDPQNLHHFQGLALDLLAETAQERPSDLTAHQAGYCYLAQREPLTDGSLPLGVTVVAGVAIVGGVAAQFFPIIGNAIGGASIAYGLAALGGATLAVDSVSRYSTAVTNDAHTQTVYQGSYAWVSAEERMISEDNRRTQRNIAAAEVGLTAIDALVIARPALALLRSRIPRPPAAVVTAPSRAVTLRAPQALVEAPLPVNAPAMIGADTVPRLPGPPAQLELPRAAELPALPAPAGAVDELPAVQLALPAPPARLSAAQREALESFQRLSPNERSQEIARIRSRLQAGEIEETEFLTLIMHTGNYTPGVFSPGPQGLAFDLLDSLGDREAALRVIREYYSGAPSATSQRRVRDLESLIDDIHSPVRAPSGTGALVPVAPRVVDVAPVAPPGLPALTGDQAPLIRSGVDEAVPRPRQGTLELPDDTYIDGTYRVITDDPALPRPDVEVPGIRLETTTGAEGVTRSLSDRVRSATTGGLRLAIRPAEEVLGEPGPDDEAVISPPPEEVREEVPPEEEEVIEDEATIAPTPLEIIVTIEADDQFFDTEFGFRQILRATATVRSGEPLPEGFQFSWTSQSLGEEGDTPPRLSGVESEILVPVTVAPYAVIASGTLEGATVIPSSPLTLQQEPIPINLNIAPTYTDTEVTLEVTQSIRSDMTPPNLIYTWEVPNIDNQSSQTITLPRRESDFTVNVSAVPTEETVLRYNVVGASHTILALADEDGEGDEEEAEWTVIISTEAIPDTATMKLIVTAVAEGGTTLPADLSLFLEAITIDEEGDAPSMPSAITGSEAEFIVPLLEHRYGVTPLSSSGDQRVEGVPITIDACFEVATAICETEDGEELDTELPLPPGQPPQRFSPLQVPTPQMFVIPGFF
jgi:hypothetical protein